MRYLTDRRKLIVKPLTTENWSPSHAKDAMKDKGNNIIDNIPLTLARFLTSMDTHPVNPETLEKNVLIELIKDIDTALLKAYLVGNERMAGYFLRIQNWIRVDEVVKILTEKQVALYFILKIICLEI